MNLAGLQTFLAIVETGNLVRAAERLHVTQSTVTSRLDTIEDALGQRLLVRSRKGAELTKAGQDWLTRSTDEIRRHPYSPLRVVVTAENLSLAEQRADQSTRIQALVQALEAGADEALMLDIHGFVSTCNATNFFMVKNKRL